MPQMAPISWLSLFLIFSISFMLFASMNYYSYMPSSPKSDNFKKNSTNSMNWKWKLIHSLYLIPLQLFSIYH